MTVTTYNPASGTSESASHSHGGGCGCGSNHSHEHNHSHQHSHSHDHSHSHSPKGDNSEIIRIMPTTQDLKKKHSDQEFIDKAMAEERSNHSNLIASSRDELPTVSVNGKQIDKTAIAQELQYHPAPTKEDAVFLATQALVVRELLKLAVHADDELGAAAWQQDEEQAISTLISKNVQATTPDDATCERYYEQNKNSFMTAPVMSVRHILLACLPEDGDARLKLKKNAYEFIEQIQSNANPEAEFILLAQQHSACPSKEQGGDLGILSQGQTVPEFESVVFALEPGLAPSPVETRYGFHIVDVLDKQAGQQLDYLQARPAIANKLSQQAFHHALCDYLYTLAEEANIEGIEMALAQENVFRG
ncbi:peptidylprolyl isomerase [Psychrobacter arenosus]|uniref:peptidylprolyl isomerase n=1 Tax=Psychrobacter arenosus TaxID=256326 RepID=UPI00191B12DD|nr:peptidylprolyl isomerase [Psychrobacter arenosus]